MTIHHDRPRPTTGLWRFVTLSLLLHAMLVWWLQNHAATPLPATQAAGTSLNIRLLQPQPADKPITRTAQPHRPVHTTSTNKNASAVPEPARNVQQRQPTETPHIRPIDTAKPEPSAAPSVTASYETIQGSLQQALNRHFVYPLLARRRGWEGEVVLGFRLESDGRIIDAHVARSSGYGILDRAALNALDKIKRIGNGPTHTIDMQLPVIYRLQEG